MDGDGTNNNEQRPEGTRARQYVGARLATRPPFSTLDDALDAIKSDIEAEEQSASPGCATSKVALGYDAIVELHRPNIGPYSIGGEHDLPAAFTAGWAAGQLNDDGSSKAYPTANIDAITGYDDAPARAVVQRAASRAIVAAIEVADGFKYSLNNAWSGKDQDGMRFSYICQDSMQNKDRHANGYTRTTKHLKGDYVTGPRKATYDCRGSISIKCSMVRRTVDISYRHYAIHSSIADRKCMPRPPFKQQRLINGVPQDDAETSEAGGVQPRSQSKDGAFAPIGTGGSNIGRKRKRDQDTPAKAAQPLSLVDLLNQSEANEKKNKQAANGKDGTKSATKTTAMFPPPMNYDLPSWQPPSPPPPTARPPRQSHPGSAAVAAAGASQAYQPPYQPPGSTQQPQTYAQYAPRTVPTPGRKQQANRTPSTTNTSAAGATPLFTTMKPFRLDEPSPAAGTPSAPAHRGRSSCTNCRYSKRRCDELRPVCSNCVKSGKYDCAYDGAYGYPASAGQRAGMGGWVASALPTAPSPVSGMGGWDGRQGVQQGYAPVQGGGNGVAAMSQYAQQPQQQQQQQQQQQAHRQGRREESPDPWFPKR